MQFFNYPDADGNDTIEQFSVLTELSDEDWQTLSKFSQNIHFTNGEKLINFGDVDDGIFILVNGNVQVLSKTRFGKSRIVAEIHQGSIFGELSFFDQQPRSAAIRAASEGDALHLTRKGFDQLAAWNPNLARLLLLDLGRVLAYRFRQATIDTI